MSRVRLMYEGDTPAGTEQDGGAGVRLRFVTPEEYFVASLAHRMNATLVFLAAAAPGRVPPDRLAQVDDAIAKAYWEQYRGCLLMPRLLRALSAVAVGPSGKVLVDTLEVAREEMFEVPSLPDALDVHASVRLQLLSQGAERFLTERQLAVGEVVVDYLMLQRAVAEDIRRAERERASGEPRCAVLDRLDRAAELEFENVISVVLRPQRVVDLIPQARRALLEEFARGRRPFFRDGIFADPEIAAAG